MTNSTQDLQVLIATNNPGKLREFETLLQSLPVRLRSLAEFRDIAQAPEPHETFQENARAKAHYYADQTRFIALSDDSGLQVDALGGAPGVYSARHGGEHLTDTERMLLLLKEIGQTGDLLRRARFVCAIAIALPNSDMVYEAIGYCEGHIAHAIRGALGFGYDPIFIPDEYQQTFAEIDVTTKNRISHRARAMREARTLLNAILTTNASPELD